MADTKLIESWMQGQNTRFMIFLGQLEGLDELVDDGTINRAQFADRVRELMKELSISLDRLEEKMFEAKRNQQVEESGAPGVEGSTVS